MSDVRLQDSHDRRQALQTAIFGVGIGIVVATSILVLIAVFWPPPLPCDLTTAKCIVRPDWGAHAIALLEKGESFLLWAVGILVGGGGGILYGRGAFDAYMGKKGPTP